MLSAAGQHRRYANFGYFVFYRISRCPRGDPAKHGDRQACVIGAAIVGRGLSGIGGNTVIEPVLARFESQRTYTRLGSSQTLGLGTSSGRTYYFICILRQSAEFEGS